MNEQMNTYINNMYIHHRDCCDVCMALTTNGHVCVYLFLILIFFFKTGFLCVALAVLELAL